MSARAASSVNFVVSLSMDGVSLISEFPVVVEVLDVLTVDVVPVVGGPVVGGPVGFDPQPALGVSDERYSARLVVCGCRLDTGGVGSVVDCHSSG